MKTNNEFPLTEQNNGYTVVNSLRVIITLLIGGISYYFKLNEFIFLSVVLLVIASIWLLLTELKIIDDVKNLNWGYFATSIDLICCGLFIYYSGNMNSLFLLFYVYVIAVCALNLKTKQGLFAVIFANSNFIIVSLLINFKIIPNVNFMGELRISSLAELISGHLTFAILTIGLYLIIRKLGIENLRLLKVSEEARIRADRSSQVKKDFLANMSHEIRTPLNGVIGMTELLSQTETSDDQKEFINQIESSGKLLLTVINDILDFSKIDSGKLEILESNFDLRKTIEDTKKSFEKILNSKQIIFTNNISDEIPNSIISDEIRLKQILFNLIGNASKFTKENGRITLDIYKVHNDSNTYLEFSVTDTGIGIEESKQKLLFNPFQQADSTVTRNFGGSGLGLVISKRLSELLGGGISFQSQIGVGSTFSFWIEFKEGKQIESTKVESKLLGTNLLGLNILIVDDVDVNRRILREYSRKLGLIPHEAENGIVAIQKLKEKNFPIVLMDMQMPEMDGVTATKKIREFNRTSKIIAITANAFEEDKQECLNAGMDDFISKPIKLQNLKMIIEKIL
ncbi:MAG: response regulator [Leptospiraceae bacterium]|nr:response regulator [Leptospiraceae bacterium]